MKAIPQGKFIALRAYAKKSGKKNWRDGLGLRAPAILVENTRGLNTS